MKDANVQKIIITTVDRKPVVHILNCKTVAEMWKNLQTIFQRDSTQQKCILQREFFGYVYDKNSDMASHVSKLENIACRLKTLGTDIDDDNLKNTSDVIRPFAVF